MLHNGRGELAEEEHISINQFATMVPAEQISALTTQEYLKKRSQRGRDRSFTPIAGIPVDTGTIPP